MSQIIWIARHGNRLDFVNPDWFNTAPKRYDPPLSEDGKWQAQKLANSLKNEPIKHIIASPFLRAIQTAYPVAVALNLPLKLEFGLSEWLNPDWMSESPKIQAIHATDELLAQYPQVDTNYLSCVIPQYPETEGKMQQRLKTTIVQLLQAFSENILLVGHSASVIEITQTLVGKTTILNTPLCGLTQVVKDDQQWKLTLNGDITHLN